MMTRQEHLQWAKERALKYLDHGELQQAVASMMSDLGKHEGTRPSVSVLASLAIAQAAYGSRDSVRRFIEGFQ